MITYSEADKAEEKEDKVLAESESKKTTEENLEESTVVKSGDKVLTEAEKAADAENEGGPSNEYLANLRKLAGM